MRFGKGKIRTQRLNLNCTPGAMLKLLAQQKDPVMLESSALHDEFGRYTILTCSPLEVITLNDGVLKNISGEIIADSDESIWSELSDAFACVDAEIGTQKPAYMPGWFGYFGYELGRHIEKLPSKAPRDTALPDVRLGFYDALLVYDAKEHTWQLVWLELENPPKDAGQAIESLQKIVAAEQEHEGDPRPVPTEHADAAIQPSVNDTQRHFTPAQYKQAVARCVEYIAAGDIFQVNLSQRFSMHGAPEPLAIHQALRKRNPAWYAAYMSFVSHGKNCAVVSSSPELFLRVRGEKVITRPIKGTRPRIADAEVDAAAAADLLSSPKDNAELAMIIDLLRNDIGRVCRFGTVKVTEPRRLETHPTVFHLVGTVEGQLRQGVGPAELLRATFPGGSITGAPKIRSMEIIDELEPVARGVYTGCIGTIGVDGSCEWNIAIRTIVCEGKTAHLQVGGGIVADSSPDGEYEETLHKARAMLEAIELARTAEQTFTKK